MNRDSGVGCEVADLGGRRALHEHLVAVEQRRLEARCREPRQKHLNPWRPDPDTAGQARGQLVEPGDRDESALVDDHDAVDGLRDLGENMARDEDGLAGRSEAADERSQPVDALWVEPVRRLVEDQELWVAEQRRREPEPLAHPERVRPHAPARRRVELDQSSTSSTRASGRLAASARVIRCSRPERPGWKSAASSTAPTSRDGSGWLAVPVPEDERLARGRSHEPEQHTQRRRLSRSVRAQKARDRARIESEAEVVDSEHAPEPLRQVVGNEHLGGRRHIDTIRGIDTSRLDRLPRRTTQYLLESTVPAATRVVSGHSPLTVSSSSHP